MKPQKAPADFVRIAAAVSRYRPDAQFLMVGDGELRHPVETEIGRLGLTGVVKLAGWRRDVPQILRCLDVLVLTSLWEGLPRVYLEAIASGVPIVGTRVDGGEEVVREGVAGYLLEPGDVQGMAEKVLQILSQGIHANQQERASLLGPEFDIREMVRLQEEEYDRLIHQFGCPESI
jgi:glycosyltransferase involved in cell wall biosynthesis